MEIRAIASGLGLALLLSFQHGAAEIDPARSPLPERARDEAHEVRSILEQHCFACHGAKVQKARLRLDTRAGALGRSRLGAGHVIEPGQSAASVLFQRITSADPDEHMPPEGEALSAAEIEALRRWIDAGAPWPERSDEAAPAAEHWAYVPPRRPSVPAPADPALARNAIDHFVQARLATEGLAPAPAAPQETLMRRASLDITGLPPSLEELDAFLGDREEGAWERAIERLLSSPAYAEHQARAWLDLARYADTDGYEKDGRRPSWRWRDWVIEAFAADMPFDRFTIEQLAGDLLPDATLSQRIATGFHRNTMVNREGGTDPEEFRVAAVVDRVNTTASVWLGTTMACAQCHDHKYDPFSQREYFQLFAFFDGTADTGNELDPQIDAPTADLERALPGLQARIAELRAELSRWKPELETELPTWKERLVAELPRWSPVQPRSFRSIRGSEAELTEEGAWLVLGEPPSEDTYVITLAPPEQGAGALRIEALRHPRLPTGGPSRGANRGFVLSEVRVFARGPGEGGELRPLRVRAAYADTYDAGPPAFPPSAAIDGDPRSGWAIREDGAHSSQLVLVLEETLAAGAAEELVLELEQSYGSSQLLCSLRVASTTSAVPEHPLLLALENERSLLSHRAVDEEGLRELQADLLARSPLLEPLRAQIARLESEVRPPKALVMMELPQRRITRIHERGSFLAQSEIVEPGTPAALHPFPPKAPRDRLGLAHWLVARDNPLTARVVVNRMWERLFGRGLVATSEDFGSQGEAPSHPELLDWLAVELMESGWSTKALLRTILCSHTYRQGSRLSPELLARDPSNVLLARSPRLRLEVEELRDLALASSGLLARQVGGRSVFPPQPEGTWAVTYSDQSWQTARDADRWRRGLYTFWRRSAPYPTYWIFDAPTRELACLRRPRTNTPLQALALLNDPAFVEAAAGLARRALREGGATDEERVAHAFRLCTARRPSERESALLLRLLAAEREHFAGSLPAAEELASCDGLLPSEGWSPVELAAWTVVANAILNLDETINRE